MKQLIKAWAVPVLLYVGSVFTEAVELRRGPYLQALHPEGVTIRWRTDTSSDGPALVRYGSSPVNLKQVAQAMETESPVEGVRDWKVSLEGLEPDTKYYYDVEVAAVTLAGPDADHYFITPPPPGKTGKLRFWCLGDSGGNRPRTLSFEQAERFGVSATVTVRNGFQAFNRGRPAHMLLLGDNAYPTGKDIQYQTAFFEPYDRLLRRMPLWPCIGNHDLTEGIFERVFTVPAGTVPSGSALYYSVDIANLHLVMLDPWMTWWIRNSEPDHPAWTKQLDWLKRDLAATKQPFIVIVNHFPVYCDGNYNSDNDLLSMLREMLVPVCDRFGVDLFLAGHDHTYQRSYLVKGLTGKQADFHAKKHLVSPLDGRQEPMVKQPGPDSGTIYVVSGNGGGVRPQGTFAHPVMVPFEDGAGEGKRGIAVPGSFVFEIEGTRLRGWSIDAAGKVLDHFTLVKEP